MYDGLTAVSSSGATPKSDQAIALEQHLLIASKPIVTQQIINDKVQIVDTSTWAQPSSTYVINATDLWENDDSHILPRWMLQYFRWHKEQTLDGYDITGPLKNKFLYVTCLKEYHKCGGTADRLLR
jgi:hypothetical protein